MATASPSPLLVAFDRPLAERLEAKGPEASAGEFAGLMGQLVHAPAPAKPTEAPPSPRHGRNKGPKALAEKPQAEAQTATRALPEESPVAAPPTGSPAAKPTGPTVPPAAPGATLPPVKEQRPQGHEPKAQAIAVAPEAPLDAPTQAPEARMEASAPLSPQPMSALPLDFSALVVPVPAPGPAGPEQGVAVTAEGPLSSPSPTPLATPAIPPQHFQSLPLPGAPSPLQQARPITSFSMPEASLPLAPQAEVLRSTAIAPTAPEAADSPLLQAPQVSPSPMPDASLPPTSLLERLKPAATAPEAPLSAEGNRAPAAPSPAPPVPSQALLQSTLVFSASQPMPLAPATPGALLPQPLGPSVEELASPGPSPATPSIAAGPQAPVAALILNSPALTTLTAGPILVIAGAPTPAVAQAEPTPALPSPSALPAAAPAPHETQAKQAAAFAFPSASPLVPEPTGAPNPPQPQGGAAAPALSPVPAPVLTTAQAALAEPSPRMKEAVPLERPLQKSEAMPSEEPIATPNVTSAGISQEVRREILPFPGRSPVPAGSPAQEVAPEALPGRGLLDTPTAAATTPEFQSQKTVKLGPSASLRAQDGSPLAALTALPPVAEAAAPQAQTAPAAAAPPSAPALQLEGGLKWMLKGGAQEAQLQLHPESLGQVTIHLKVEGGEVHVRLWVTDPTSMQAVRDGREHLGVSLKEQGLQLGSFDLQQGHRPFQEAPVAPVVREHLLPERIITRQEAPAVARPAILNPHHVELYA